MTQTLEPTAVAEPSAARKRVESWLADFEAALAARDAERAAGLFATTCFWRDLVAFTWNIKTVEGRDGVRRHARGTRSTTTDADGLRRRRREPAEADGVIDGVVHLRDRGRPRHRAPAAATTARPGRCSPRSTSSRATRSSTAPTRPKGVEHGADPDRETWLERARSARRRSSATTDAARTCDRSAAGRAASRSARGCASSACPTIIVEQHARPGDSWRKPLQVALPARPGLVRPPALHAVPRQLAGLLAEGQDRRLARDVHEGHGAATTGRSTTATQRDVRRGDAGVDGRRRARRRARSTLRPKQLVLATGMSGKPNVPTLPGPGRLPRRPAPLLAAPRPGRLRRQAGVVIGSNNSAHDICAALWEHGADVTMVQRSSTHIVQLRHADGHRARRPVLGAGGRRRASRPRRPT